MEGVPPQKSTSKDIEELFESDQADRTQMRENLDDSEFIRNIVENDAIRLKKAREIYENYKSGEIELSGKELVQLAFLFQHSLDTDDYWIAHELGEAAGVEGKWIAAAAEDRYLLSKDGKQKWGTQFLKDEQAPMLSDDESGITDEMRLERGIPTRDEQLKKHLDIRKADH